MNGPALDRVFRAASGRIIAALAARFHNIDLAEDAFAESCVRALRAWPEHGAPNDPAAWLYRTSERIAFDELRRKRLREIRDPIEPELEPSAEDLLIDDAHIMPDQRLRLIFICCHPAVAPDARAALTLRLVCGLTVTEIARAFLVQESTLAQRLVRAKHKIAEAGVPFELPARELWPDRMEAILSTLEVAYSKAHEDAGGHGIHAGFAAEMLHLSKLLTELVPHEAEAFALAALVHYAEARRPARVDSTGVMVALAEQDPHLWRRELIAQADELMAAAVRLAPEAPRVLQAKLQRLWCMRNSLAEPPPWPEILSAYDEILRYRDDPFVQLNRMVALAEVEGPEAALAAISAMDSHKLIAFLPYHAVCADLLRRTGKVGEARAAYARAIALQPAAAERSWLERRVAELQAPSHK